MILPSTYISAIVLLVVSFFCLGLWINTFKVSGARWRFELFSIDFAIGAILLSVIAAFTLGSLGMDLAFSDRMLVAGRAAQAFVVAAGAIFTLGNMLLLAAVSILGVAAAFSLCSGIALIITSLFYFHHGNILLLVSGIVVMLIGVVLDVSACRMRERAARKSAAAAKEAQKQSAGAKPAPANTAPTSAASASVKTTAPRASKRVARPSGAKTRARSTTKGLIVAVLSGIALGVFYPVAAKGLASDFGLGPYAGILMFSIGVLVATIVLNFYFLNIAIQGETLSFGAYFRGNVRQHFLGFAGGALWAGGALAALLGNSLTGPMRVAPAIGTIVPLASVLLAMLCGVLAWKDFASAPGHAKISLGLTGVLFACSLILLGIGIVS